MKKIWILILFLCLGCSQEKAYHKIEGSDLNSLIKEGAIVLDVRSSIEYEQGHIAGAKQVPYYEVDTLNYDKNKKIIVYCETGSRSKKAADLLIELGYKHIYDLGSKKNFNGALVTSKK